MPLHVHSKCRKSVLAVLSFDLGLAPAGVGHWRHCDEWWLSSSSYTELRDHGVDVQRKVWSPTVLSSILFLILTASEKQQLWKMNRSSKTAFFPASKPCALQSAFQEVCAFLSLRSPGGAYTWNAPLAVSAQMGLCTGCSPKSSSPSEPWALSLISGPWNTI